MINNVFKFPNRYNCRKTVATSKSFIVNTVKFHTPIYQGFRSNLPAPTPLEFPFINHGSHLNMDISLKSTFTQNW